MGDTDPILKKKIRFEATLTLGAIIQICTLIFIAGGAYYKSTIDVASVRKDMLIATGAFSKAQEELTVEVRELKSQVGELAISNERLKTMLDDDRRAPNSRVPYGRSRGD
jgi:hypothetical protein